MVSTIPAIKALVAAASTLDEPIHLVDSVPQPRFAVETFDIFLRPEHIQANILCNPPFTNCYPIDPDIGVPSPNHLTQSFTAPDNSVISKYAFNGIQRDGNVGVIFEADRAMGTISANVAASENAIVKGDLKVYYDPLVIQMAYPVNITEDRNAARLVATTEQIDKVFSAEAGYRFVDAEFQPQYVQNATFPKLIISPAATSVQLTTSITSDPADDPPGGWLHGVILTKQERISEPNAPR